MLLVEDIDINREIASFILTDMGFQVEAAEKAGMNDHIAKPLDVPIMKKTIKRVLGTVH